MVVMEGEEKWAKGYLQISGSLVRNLWPARGTNQERKTCETDISHASAGRVEAPPYRGVFFDIGRLYLST